MKMIRRLTPWWVVAWLPLLLIPVGLLFAAKGMLV